MKKLLSKVQIIAIEVGGDCNLKQIHDKCPINHRRILHTEYGELTAKDITQAINEAVEMGFEGYFGFHFYNEPMLYKNEIQEIIEANNTVKYLLWTNGTMLHEGENKFLDLFNKVVITCYDEARLKLYMNLQKKYKQILIQKWDLDDRLDIYTQNKENNFGCKRIFFEIPIDYYGNVHLCCRDWNNTHFIGNIKDKGLTSVMQSNTYKNILDSVGKRILNLDNCPSICKHCDEPWIKLPESW